jgi:small-conductance mechanosensitive channel
MVNLESIKQFFDLSQPGLMIKLIAALGIVIIGIIFGRIISKLIKRGLHELELNRILRENANMRVDVEKFVSSFILYLIYFAAIIMALDQIGITTTIAYILLIVVLVVIIIFIIIAFKDFIPNVTAGFFVNQRHMIKQNEYIKVKNIEGKVISIDLIETRLQTDDGDIIFIPNMVFLKNEIIKVKKKK